MKIEDEELPLHGDGELVDHNVHFGGIGRAYMDTKPGATTASHRRQRKRSHDGLV